MTDLIERLERATGPEFALDCAIFETVLPEEWFGSKVISWFSHGGKYGCNTEDGYRHLECLTAPAYTASLDAALTLVPAGLDWFVKHYASAGGKFGAVVTSPEIAARSWGDYSHDNSPTPALALCIAALKAREAAK